MAPMEKLKLSKEFFLLFSDYGKNFTYLFWLQTNEFILLEDTTWPTSIGSRSIMVMDIMGAECIVGGTIVEFVVVQVSPHVHI